MATWESNGHVTDAMTSRALKGQDRDMLRVQYLENGWK